MKNKILSHFDDILSYVEDNLIEACCIIAIVVVLIGVLIGTGSLSVHAASVSDEIQPAETIPLNKGYIQMPSSSYGFMLAVDPSSSYSDFVVEVLNETMDAGSPFRYRFHGSDTINYINSFTIETISSDSFRILASDGFVGNATFATVTLLGNLISIAYEPVDYVCVADTMSSAYVLDYYILGITGLGYPIEHFINYGSGGGGSTPTVCPTLPEMLQDYTGTFDSIVDMLNTRNYDQYEMYVEEAKQAARDAGKQEGLQEGFLIGKDAGYMEGEVDGFQDGYNKGASDQLVKGFFGNLFSGIIEAFEKVEFYNDGTLVINFWTIFCSVVILSIIIILLKVWRGG